MTTNSLLVNRNLCTGCTACFNICPVNAISLTPNEEGFLYPEVNGNLCIDCKKCIGVCQIHNNWVEKISTQYSQKLFAAKTKDEGIRKKSSSGGLFTIIAEHVLKHNGIVYAVKLDEQFNCVHFSIKSINDLDKARGSKYVQSCLDSLFNDLQKNLINNKYVLFVGTPCQVAGLKLFLNKDYGNLLTIDLFCLGVNSPLVYKDWVSFLQIINMNTINFRCKTTSWNSSKIAIESKNAKEISNYKTEYFSSLFGDHYILRRSCYTCHFSQSKRAGDISLGDFWGIETLHPEFDDDKGISAVVINTKKGMDIFNKIKNELNILMSEYNKYISFQPCLHKPAWLPKNRNQFWNEYFKKGFERTAKKYVGKDIISRGIRFIKKKVLNAQR